MPHATTQAGEFSRALLRAASAAAAEITAEELEMQHKGEVPLKLLQAAEREVRASADSTESYQRFAPTCYVPGAKRRLRRGLVIY